MDTAAFSRHPNSFQKAGQTEQAGQRGQTTPSLVVTLTGKGGQKLVQLARARGWQAQHIAGLCFQPLPDQGRLQQLGGVDWLLLTSPKGARCTAELLAGYGCVAADLRGLRLAAVGAGTAQPLERWGKAADFVPSEANAKALAAELPACAGEHVLHVTGEASRDTLQRGLEARGVRYERLNVYRSAAPQYSPAELAALLAADWVVVASGVAARGLAAQAGTGLRLVAMGEQTAAAARAAGFAGVIEAQAATPEGILEAIIGSD